jgi:uncharacterized protein with ParB-like and HNH nuclease domain
MSLTVKPIEELKGMNFFIPAYQRGYRWTEPQVKDLLGDIEEFITDKKDGFYCIQPLVVKSLDQDLLSKIQDKNKTKSIQDVKNLLQGRWEVIDGQQRLTTIYVILSYLNPSLLYYTIDYKTRKNSKRFLESKLKNIEIETNLSVTDIFSKVTGESPELDHIDFYHIIEAKHTIHNWFIDKDEKYKNEFLNTLLEKVKFIWYQTEEAEPIKIFTRLNIGKIPLTNAELIKALFLNSSNFEGDSHKIRLLQQEIAIEWDNIEYMLQNDEFWLFLNEVGYDKPTRIDFIFDLICEKDMLKPSLTEKQKEEELGSDKDRTFRYFYLWFKNNKGDKKYDNVLKCWQIVKSIFKTFDEWFNDLEYYHHIGFLIEQKMSLIEILDKWNKSPNKEIFKEEIVHSISRKICINNASDLSSLVYKDGRVRSVLLLHNILTIVNQNITLEENSKYKLPVFYKFAFHLFKQEDWDVEHIDSNTENQLEDAKSQKEWLKTTIVGGVLNLNNELKNDIKKFINLKEDENGPNFKELHDKIIALEIDESDKMDDEEKDKIWNLALLDASTNRSYGNSIFSSKRRAIIGKDQGKSIIINDELEPKVIEGQIAFIPPCTKNLFLKYYSVETNNLREWNRTDAKAYLDNIEETLEKFLKK